MAVLVLVDGALHLALDVRPRPGRAFVSGRLRVAFASSPAGPPMSAGRANTATTPTTHRIDEAEQRARSLSSWRRSLCGSRAVCPAGAAVRRSSMQRDGCGGAAVRRRSLATRPYSRMPCSIKRPPASSTRGYETHIRSAKLARRAQACWETAVQAFETRQQAAWRPAGCLLRRVPGTSLAMTRRAILLRQRARLPLDLEQRQPQAFAGCLHDRGRFPCRHMRHLFARSACCDGKHGATGKKGRIRFRDG